MDFLQYPIILYPSSRQPTWFPHQPTSQQTFLNVFTNLLSCIDNIAHNFDTCHIESSTCLSLLILSIIQHPPNNTSPPSTSFIPPSQLFDGHFGVKKLLAIDVFTFDYDTQVIRPRHRASLEFHRFPTLSHRVAQCFLTNQLSAVPFFMASCLPSPRHSLTPSTTQLRSPQLTPFCQRLIKPPFTYLPPTNFPLNSIHYYKFITAIIPTATIRRTLSGTKWSMFWSLEIPLQARTIWFRVIHNKIPTRQSLNLFMPTAHPSPNCSICSSEPEDLKHFFFSCPPKLAIWRTTFQLYLSTLNPTYSTLLETLHKLFFFSIEEPERDNSLPFTELSVSQVFACILMAIWQHHWRFIFDDTPFISSNVLTSIARSLARLDTEFQTDFEV